MLSCKIIEYLKNSGFENYQEVNRVPSIIHPAPTGMSPLYSLPDYYREETNPQFFNSVLHGEKYGSPNTKKALEWYKANVSWEQYCNSHYDSKVLKRIPGKQTLIGDWHNHDIKAYRKIYLISSSDTTLVLNLPRMRLPAIPHPTNKNEGAYFPIINKMIAERIIPSKYIIRPKKFQILEIDPSTVHMSALLPINENISKEPYRWFMFIKY